MALMRGNVPKGCIQLNETEATVYIWDVVTEWKDLSDTWALRYSPAILGGINGLSGILIYNHFRNKLKLASFGYVSAVIPLSLLPGIFTALFHRHVVSTGLLLKKDTKCSICYEMKATFIQSSLGIAYPMVLAPISSLLIANKYATIRVPYWTEGIISILQFLKKKCKNLGPRLGFLVTVQLMASSILTYYEIKNNISLNTKLTEIEKQFGVLE